MYKKKPNKTNQERGQGMQELTTQIEDITNEIIEVKNNLSGLKNMSAKRQLGNIIDRLDDFYNELSQLELKANGLVELNTYELVKEEHLQRLFDVFGKWSKYTKTRKTKSVIVDFVDNMLKDEYTNILVTMPMALETETVYKPSFDNVNLVAVSDYIFKLIKHDYELFGKGCPSVMGGEIKNSLRIAAREIGKALEAEEQQRQERLRAMVCKN